MRTVKIIILTLCASFVSGGIILPAEAESSKDFSNLKISYSEPTAVKNDSGGWTFGGIPIGNGKIGAKIYGGTDKDIYQLNDASFWSGGPAYTDLYDESGARKQALDNTRALLEGDLTDWDNIEAIESSAKEMVGDNSASSYLPVGNLVIDMSDDASYSNYNRTLDLDTATVTTSYVQDGVKYTRTAFASYPDNVIAIKLESDGEDTLDFKASLTFPDEKPESEGAPVAEATADNEYSLSWRAPVLADTLTWADDYGMTVGAKIRIVETDGTVTPTDDGLELTGANEAVILYSSETSFNGFDRDPTVGSGEEKDYKTLLDGYMNSAEEKGYDELYERHLEDYQSLFERLWVNIDSDPEHVLAYQYKRYEIISMNRSGSFFNMGYGMWNPQMNPTSWGNHYMNENVIKQNSFVEAANLAEMQEPVINWLEDLAENGRKTAEYDFGFRGWMAPHHSDIWAVTSLQGDGSKRTEWSIFPVGGMWTTLLAWEHYKYNMDEDYLKNTLYPLLEGAAAFACDWLVEREFTADEITGEPGVYLVTSPSTSAENSYGLNYGAEYVDGLWQAVSVGTTQDMTIVRGIFEEYIEACEILGIEPELLAEVSDKLSRLLPYQIHKDGELQEWAFEQMKPSQNRTLYSSHRHASQLLGLWPYNFINSDTPELYEAADIALDNRGSGNAARMPDKAAMLLRLGRADEALDYMPTGKNTLIGQWTDAYQNAFCEFIVQSQNGYIDLLPALPSSWETGEIRGTRVRGGYELDIKWTDGELESCTVYSKAGGGFPEIRLGDEALSEDDERITFVEDPDTETEAENISGQISNISKGEDDIVRMDYSVRSEDRNTATKITAYLAVYDITDGTPVLKQIETASDKIYGTQTISDSIKFDGSGYIADGRKYLFKGFIWRDSNQQPLGETKALSDVEFTVREIYNSLTDFNGEQGPVWYFRYTSDGVNFKDMENYNSDKGGYWSADTRNAYCHAGGEYMHPNPDANSVRTFKAPADGTIRILPTQIKANDSSGTRDGIGIKIVKQSADLTETEQIYPEGDDYRIILNAEQRAGASVPEITADVKAGDTINFILNMCDENAHDGTDWVTEIEYVQ